LRGSNIDLVMGPSGFQRCRDWHYEAELSGNHALCGSW
jgi:hypothetical protein